MEMAVNGVLRSAVPATIASIAVGSFLSASTASAAGTVASPTQLSWAGQTFQRPQELAHWLQQRGGRYVVWAARHPRGRAIIERDVPALSPPNLPALTPAASGGRTATFAIATALFILAAVCVITALVPKPIAVSRFGGRLLPLAEHRLVLLATGAAIGVGALLSAYS
jgi:hypothetical protein